LRIESIAEAQDRICDHWTCKTQRSGRPRGTSRVERVSRLRFRARSSSQVMSN
jgi:hypothetical protein